MTLADILRGGLYVLDTPGALTRGAVANLADIVRGQDRFQGYRATGREMLESMGMERNRPGLDVGDVAGVGADILVDPVNWAGGWAAKAALNAMRAKKAMQAGEVAAQAARPGLGEIISQSRAMVPRQPSGLEGVLKMMPQQPMPMTGMPAKPPAPLGLPYEYGMGETLRGKLPPHLQQTFDTLPAHVRKQHGFKRVKKVESLDPYVDEGAGARYYQNGDVLALEQGVDPVTQADSFAHEALASYLYRLNDPDFYAAYRRTVFPKGEVLKEGFGGYDQADQFARLFGEYRGGGTRGTLRELLMAFEEGGPEAVKSMFRGTNG